MPQPKSQAQRDLLVTAIVLGLFLLIGLGIVIGSGPDRSSAALLWSLGCGVTGFVVGFLFGFPKLVTDERPATERIAQPEPSTPTAKAAAAQPASGFAHRLAINTNLEQVSDWLTKIIVGVGLVELKNAPAFVTRAGRYFGAGFGGGPDVAAFNERLAAAILVFFGGIGLLAGYLLTRMFFSAAFRRADVGTVGDEEAKAVADTPLESEGRKIELSAAAKAISARLARASREEVEGSAEGLAAWARVQFDNGQYEDAITAYANAVKLSPSDPRLRYVYAIALKYGQRPTAEYWQQLEEARQLARSNPDADLRRQVVVAYTFNALYLDPPTGFERARDAAIEYVGNTQNLPSGDVWFNLACAYGQQYAHETQRTPPPDSRVLQELRAKSLEALKRALEINPQLIPRAQEMLQGRAREDDDLNAFSGDADFRAAAKLPPA
jgi:tetratricopeptide (TPR) repeat protein